MKRLVAICSLVFACPDVVGQCPNGVCPLRPAVAPPIVLAAPAAVVAVQPVGPPEVSLGHAKDDPDHVVCVSVQIGGAWVQIGKIDLAAERFLAHNGDRWHIRRERPTGDAGPVRVGQMPPGGIEPDKVCPDGKGGFSVNGVPCSKAKAFESLTAGGTLTDDSARLRLTVIGTEADRKRVLADLKGPALAAILADVIVSEYPPDAWPVKGLGFKVDGKPAVYIQAANGRVIHRQDEYDGPDRLAGAIRRAKEGYDPAKDRDLRDEPKPVAPPAPEPKSPAAPLNLPQVPAVWLAIGAAAVWLFNRGRQSLPAQCPQHG